LKYRKELAANDSEPEPRQMRGNFLRSITGFLREIPKKDQREKKKKERGGEPAHSITH